MGVASSKPAYPATFSVVKKNSPGRQLQEADALVGDGRLEEDDEVLREGEAPGHCDGRGEGRQEHALAELVEVVPDRHGEVVGELLLLRVEEALDRGGGVVVEFGVVSVFGGGREEGGGGGEGPSCRFWRVFC